ncbi:MAG TPA: energy-coupling factor transporter transmembrane protein EcfT [Jiangellales bacterium]|nr:energy-coupling factor transporter transmembrane protein EcfT [Jiangellales bacterium]
MSVVGLYVPGSSVLHRCPPGVKLAALALLLVVTLRLRTPAQVLAAGALVAAGYAVAGVPWRAALSQVRPLLWLAVLIGAWQVLLAGWDRAMVVVGQLVVAVALAGLVTVTTRTSELLDVLERALRPLRRLGVDAGRVALVLALTVRAVPVLVRLAGEVREAHRARGVVAGPRAYAVPLLVRTLRHADALGEALVARGLDD